MDGFDYEEFHGNWIMLFHTEKSEQLEDFHTIAANLTDFHYHYKFGTSNIEKSKKFVRKFDMRREDPDTLVIVKDKYWHKPNIALAELPRILEENQLNIYEHKRIPKKYMPTI